MCLSANSSSTRVLSTLFMPAWWMANPYERRSFSSGFCREEYATERASPTFLMDNQSECTERTMDITVSKNSI